MKKNILQGPMKLTEVSTCFFLKEIHDVSGQKFRILSKLAWNDP